MATHAKIQTLIPLLALVGLSLADKPHLIMIMADDLGWNDVGFNGRSEILTPHIDQLAATGVKLNNYYTAPQCGPSRAQFLTGKDLTHIGLQHGNLSPCVPKAMPLTERTIADELKLLDYKTHLIGKWHAGFHTTDFLPTNRGFDTFRGLLNGLGHHYKHTRGYKGTQILDFYNDTIPNPTANGVYSTDYYRDRALEIIEEHSQTGEPMFMFLSFQAPHTPNQAPSAYINNYSSIALRKRKRFAAMVTAMDDAINEVVKKLKGKGMYDNSVIVFSTDNGGQAKSGGSNFPLRGNKNTYYEAGVKGVGLVVSPLLENVRDIESLVHISDWKPTFIHLAGGNVDDLGLDGVNQWDTLAKGGAAVRTEIIHNIDPLSIQGSSTAFVDEMSAAIRSGDWKLMTGEVGFNGIVPNPKTDLDGYQSASFDASIENKVRLFNIKLDPTESNEVSDENPAMVDYLRGRLTAHQRTAVDPQDVRRSDACAPQSVWGPYL